MGRRRRLLNAHGRPFWLGLVELPSGKAPRFLSSHSTASLAREAGQKILAASMPGANLYGGRGAVGQALVIVHRETKKLVAVGLLRDSKLVWQWQDQGTTRERKRNAEGTA